MLFVSFRRVLGERSGGGGLAGVFGVGLLIEVGFVAGVGTAPPRISTSYIAITDNILHRMRFPKFLMVVREELGEEVGNSLFSSAGVY